MQKILILISVLLLQACSNLEFPGVYKLPIEQGNVITQEMIDQLKPGMSKSQVEYVLGTALIKDYFNGQRWDYVYSIERNNEERQQQRLSIFFDESNKLSHFTGDFRPSSGEENTEITD